MLKKNGCKPAHEAGRNFERDFFGSVWKDYELNLPDWLEKDAAIQNVTSLQKEIGWSPEEPKTKLAREVFDCVKSYLPREQRLKLRMFCCLGTSLDFHHGCDCLMAIVEGGVVSSFVTIDLSLTEKQRNELKADVNITHNGWTFSVMWRKCHTIAEKLSSKK